MRRSLSNPVDSEPKKMGHTCTSNVSMRSFAEDRKLASQTPARRVPTSASSVKHQTKPFGASPMSHSTHNSTASQSLGMSFPLNPAPHRSLEFFLSKKGQYLMTQDIRYPSHYRKHAFLILPHFFGHPEFAEILAKKKSRLRINRRES